MAKPSFSLDDTTGFYNNLRFLTKKRRTTDRNIAKLSFSLDKTTIFYKLLRFLTKKRRTTDRNMAKLAFSLDETTGFYENLCFLTKKRRTTDVQPGERSPTPGTQNLNENPAPEELSGNITALLKATWRQTPEKEESDVPSKWYCGHAAF